jgi:hypothetical protein
LPKKFSCAVEMVLPPSTSSSHAVEYLYREAVHPGGIQTELGRYVNPSRLEKIIEQTNQQLAAEGKAPFQWKTIPQGAASSVWADMVASADEIGGRYCENCHVGKTVPDDTTITAVSEGVRGYALDTKNAEILWKKSEELVGESF